MKECSHSRRVLWDCATGGCIANEKRANFLPITVVAIGALLHMEQLLKQQEAKVQVKTAVEFEMVWSKGRCMN